MDARDIYNLYSAYRSVYEDRESLNEDVDYDLEEANRYEQRLGGRGIEPVLIRSDRNRKFDGEDLDLKGEAESIKKHPRYVAGHRRGGNPKLELRFHPRIEAHKERRGVKKQRGMKEELDLYDVVLDHLLDEGYCDDVESAEVIMANMSEEWVDCILEKADNTIRLVYGKGGKGVPFGNDSNVLRTPNVGFDKQGDSFRQATRDAARRFAEKESKKIDSQDGVDARLSATQRKNISRLNSQSNNKQSEGGVASLTPGGSHYREVPTDYRARKRRASGR